MNTEQLTELPDTAVPEPEIVLIETPEETPTPPAPDNVIGKPKVITEVRNPRYTRGEGRIDCEVKHAEFGWIPFLACEADVEEHGREIYAQIIAGDWGAIAPLVAPTVAQRKQAIADRRYQAEVSGVVFGGMRIDSGRDSQGLITGATLASVLDPSYICHWKTPEGFVELNATMLAAVSQAVRAHVQACFDRERVLVEAVTAGTFTDAMLETGWPTYE